MSVPQTETSCAQLIASMAIDFQDLYALFTPAQDEEKFLKEVERLGGAGECLKNETKLSELAAQFISSDDSAKRGPQSSAQTTQLSAAELRGIRPPVEQILERNLLQYRSRIDYLVDKAKRERTPVMKLTSWRLLRLARLPSVAYDLIENPVRAHNLSAYIGYTSYAAP